MDGLRIDDITCNSSREGAARDVLVIIFDQDAVVSWQDRQVGHSARPILVVQTADVRLGWTLNGQRQTTYKNMPGTDGVFVWLVFIINCICFYDCVAWLFILWCYPCLDVSLWCFMLFWWACDAQEISVRADNKVSSLQQLLHTAKCILPRDCVLPSPASLVLTVKTAGLLTVPWMRPGP